MSVIAVETICGSEWFALSARLNVKSDVRISVVLSNLRCFSQFVSFWQYIERLLADAADMKRGYFDSCVIAFWLPLKA